MDSKPQFVFPTVRENPSGWGPCDLPEQFKDVPYQPFSKSDRVGKVSPSLYGLVNSLLPYHVP